MMDTERKKQYESPKARLRAMYQLPDSSRPFAKVVEVIVGDGPGIVDQHWPRQQLIRWQLPPTGKPAQLQSQATNSNLPSLAGNAPYASDSSSGELFDIAILHYTFDCLCVSDAAETRRRASEDLLQQVVMMLNQGGTLVGCTGNRSMLGEFFRRVPYCKNRPREPGRPPVFSISECKTALRNAGLQQTGLFNVIRSADDPRGLVSIDAKASRRAFRHELEAVSESLGFAGYAARRVFTELSLNRFIEPSLFFFGYKSC